ncbi:hypothetical protein EDB82DRAFT_486787 [Fusarium venenatum]|uniref:uncharacterized protein n=1 Tax=Fusarium venenatum TaxID=56646 RepID=UPI001D6598AC|nr:hypothetical protein EDB82DRAFT_486787 [Fusarium venenatum]
MIFLVHDFQALWWLLISSSTPFLFQLLRPFGSTVGCAFLGLWKTCGTSKNWLKKSLSTLFLCQGTCYPRSSCPTLELRTTDRASTVQALTGFRVSEKLTAGSIEDEISRSAYAS